MAMAITTTTTTSVKRSWSDIVKGVDATASAVDVPTPEALSEPLSHGEAATTEAAGEKTIRPAARGTHQCYCWGEILVMLNHYGWIMAYDDIDHPDIGKTNGRVYLHKRDICGRTRLARGDVVTFFLYADEQGLGAEQCSLERKAISDYPVADGFKRRGKRCLKHSIPPTLSLSSGWDVLATEFIPSHAATKQLNLAAPEFVPGGLNTNANILSINPAFLSDYESDGDLTHNDADVSSNDGDKESTCDEDEVGPSNEEECDEVFTGLTNYKDLAQCFCHDDDYESVFVGLTNYKELAQCFSSGDDEEGILVGSTCDKEPLQHFSRDNEHMIDDELVFVHAPLKAQQQQSEDSTSAGGSSDSECEVSDGFMFAPQGLQLPAGFRPPPGLSL
jgi:hypothetical protein